MPRQLCLCHQCGSELIRFVDPSRPRLHFCNRSICKAEYQRTFKPVTKEWLEDHYLRQGLDTTQIGKLVSRDPKSVWNWLIDFGIPTRSRGGLTSPNCFKKGAKNPFEGRKHTEETKEKIRAIAKATGRVPYDPAVGSYMKGRSGSRSTNWKGGITPDRQALYNSAEWKECVKSVWSRDDAKCRRCGLDHRTLDRKSKEYRKFVLHHVVGFEVKELRAEPSNLVLLCRPCHLWVHSKKNTNKEFIGRI